MRWPWQRKEADPEPGTPAGTAVGQASGAPAVPPPRAQAGPPPSPAGWAFLPPLQRTLGDLETTTAPRRFTDRLPTRTDPSFTGTMSHLVTADAPPGVIDLDGPDAGPVPGRTGPASAPVEMTLLRPSIPRGPRGGPGTPVQRLTAGAPVVQRPLTSVPEGSFGVLEVPVVHEAGTEDVPPTPDPPVETEDSRAAPGNDADSGAEADGVPAGVPAPGLSSADPLAGGAPASSPDSTYDGAATFVPLPVRPTLQRSTTAADRGAPPAPAPPRPPGSHRRGLGRPWPEPLGSSAGPATAEAAPPAVQRSAAFAELPVARLAAAPEPETASGPPEQEPADATDATAGPAPASPPDDDGPGPSSPARPVPAVAFPEPVVSRSSAEQSAPAQLGESPRNAGSPGNGENPARGTAGPGAGPTVPAGAVRTRFPDPPLFAGRQSPDLHRMEALPVVSRATGSAVLGTSGRVDSRTARAPAGVHGPSGRIGSAPVAVTTPEVSSLPVPVPAAQAHAAVQRSVEPGTEAAGDSAGDARPEAPALPAAPSRSRADAAAGPPEPAAAPELPPVGGPPDRTRPVDLPVASRSAASSEPVVPRAAAAVPTLSLPTLSVPTLAGPRTSAMTSAGTSAGSGGAGQPGTAPLPRARVLPPPATVPSLQRSPASQPFRPPGPHPPPSRPGSLLSGPVVSRSVSDAPGAEAPTTLRTAISTGRSAGPAAPTIPAHAAMAPQAGTPAAPVPTVARTVAPDPVLPLGPGEAAAADPGADGPRSVGADLADEASPGEVPVRSATTSTATTPVSARGGPRSWNASGAGPSPVGTLQRSTGGDPLPVRGTQPVVGPDPVATRLAAPATEAPRPGHPVETPAGPGSGTPTGTGTVQRATGEAGPATGTPADPARPAAAPAAPAAPAGEGMSQDQVDELARRLVGPIVRRIKADMLLDRERRGLRTDVI